MKPVELSLLIALALPLAAPALAGGPAAPAPEPVVVAPPPAPPATRDWSGFYAGAQLGFADFGASGTTALDGNGGLGGVHAGYRWDLGTTVLGVEADWDSSNVDLGTGADTLDNIARMKLTAGYDMGRALAYATAGAAHANATVGGADQSGSGWLLGAGVTYALTDSWTLGGEVLTHRFSDFGTTGTDLDATTASLRVGLRF